MGNDSRRKPVRKESPFREWVSDNLRYIILIAVLAAAVLIMLFALGIFSTGKDESASADSSVFSEAEVSTITEKDSASEVSPTPSAAPTVTPAPAPSLTVTEAAAAEPEKETGIEDAPDDIKDIIGRYFQALINGDPNGAAAVTESITESDVTAILNGVYMRDYADIEVSTYPGEKENEYVALVSYTYTYPGFETRIPALTALYIVQGPEGTPLIGSENTEDKKSEVISRALASDGAIELRNQISARYDEALASDPELAQYIASLS